MNADRIIFARQRCGREQEWRPREENREAYMRDKEQLKLGVAAALLLLAAVSLQLAPAPRYRL